MNENWSKRREESKILFGLSHSEKIKSYALWNVLGGGWDVIFLSYQIAFIFRYKKATAEINSNKNNNDIHTGQ